MKQVRVADENELSGVSVVSIIIGFCYSGDDRD